MKPPPFTLTRPATIEECLHQLQAGPDVIVKVISGGQSLMPLLALRMANPDVLVDIGGLDELISLEVSEEAVRIGARVRHHQLTEEPIRSLVPILGSAAAHIGHVAIRNRGTIGGSLAHADPAAELPAVMVLLEAGIECRSQDAGTRVVPAHEFFTGPYSTGLGEDELLTAVLVPRPVPGTRHGFVEFSSRHGDYARAGALCTLRVSDGGVVTAARLVLFATGSVPVDVSEQAAAAVGTPVDRGDWAAIATAAVGSLPPPEDADRKNRHRLAEVAVRRALAQAATAQSTTTHRTGEAW